MSKMTKNISELRTLLESMGMDESAIEAQVKKAEAHVKEPARKAIQSHLEDAMKKALTAKVVKDNMQPLQKGSFTVSFTFDEGKVKAVASRVASSKSSSAKAGGKRPTIVCGGAEWATFAVLCKHYNVAVGGDSARRAYDRAHTSDPDTYPAYEEVANADS